jgi:hypothetical protein
MKSLEQLSVALMMQSYGSWQPFSTRTSQAHSSAALQNADFEYNMRLALLFLLLKLTFAAEINYNGI